MLNILGLSIYQFWKCNLRCIPITSSTLLTVLEKTFFICTENMEYVFDKFSVKFSYFITAIFHSHWILVHCSYDIMETPEISEVDKSHQSFDTTQIRTKRRNHPRYFAGFIKVLFFLQLSEEIVQEVVKNCHNLERLDMSGVRCVDDSILISLAHNSNCLKALSLKGCRQVTLTLLIISLTYRYNSVYLGKASVMLGECSGFLLCYQLIVFLACKR